VRRIELLAFFSHHSLANSSILTTKSFLYLPSLFIYWVWVSSYAFYYIVLTFQISIYNEFGQIYAAKNPSCLFKSRYWLYHLIISRKYTFNYNFENYNFFIWINQNKIFLLFLPHKRFEDKFRWARCYFFIWILIVSQGTIYLDSFPCILWWIPHSLKMVKRYEGKETEKSKELTFDWKWHIPKPNWNHERTKNYIAFFHVLVFISL
jgi:hypothetical protein